ncbi:hypothetical protein JVU11DRAFT_7818 [Chiua virens]|nr:hypothetical protein JVU11DRAFT_7818 [Chiua virens]
MRQRLILFVATHFSHALAWSWSTHQTPPDPGSGVTEDIFQNTFDAQLSQAGIVPLFTNNDALQSYQQKPDCFQEAITMVKARCEDARMDEEERIQAAIGMTMCELATARHYLPPMECAVYAKPSPKLTSPTPQAQARCVDALSRSAQFWSSYSGYLREIPQLCFTFRRWIDIDTAKDIYRNITEEKAILVRFLMEREKGSKTTQQLWENTAKDIRDTVEALHLASNGVKAASDTLTVTVLDNSQSLLAEVADAILKIEERDRINHGEIMAKFHSMLENVERQHSDHLLGVVPAIQSSITSELSTALALIKDESLRNIDVAADIERRLSLLQGGLDAMQSSLEDLTRVIDDSSKLLGASLVQSQTAQVVHSDTIESMTQLVATVHALTQTAHAEIVSINRTSSILKESLSRTPSSEWLRAVAVSLIEFFPGSRKSLVDAAINSHTLHLTFRILGVLWHSARFLISLFVSALVLINARWWPLCPRAAPSDQEAHTQKWEETDATVKAHQRPMRPRSKLPQAIDAHTALPDTRATLPPKRGGRLALINDRTTMMLRREP